MFVGLFSVSVLLMIIGALIIIFTLLSVFLKAYFKYSYQGIRALLDLIGALFFFIYDRFAILIFQKGKRGKLYKSEADIRYEEKQEKINNVIEEYENLRYLGATRFVENLKLRYPHANSSVFKGLVDRVYNIQHVDQLKEIEREVARSAGIVGAVDTLRRSKKK